MTAFKEFSIPLFLWNVIFLLGEFTDKIRKDEIAALWKALSTQTNSGLRAGKQVVTSIKTEIALLKLTSGHYVQLTVLLFQFVLLQLI